MKLPGAEERHDATAPLAAGYVECRPGPHPARSNLSLTSAAFGGLFHLPTDESGVSARIVGVLAESYEILDDGRGLRILRKSASRSPTALHSTRRPCGSTSSGVSDPRAHARRPHGHGATENAS